MIESAAMIDCRQFRRRLKHPWPELPMNWPLERRAVDIAIGRRVTHCRQLLATRAVCRPHGSPIILPLLDRFAPDNLDGPPPSTGTGAVKVALGLPNHKCRFGETGFRSLFAGPLLSWKPPSAPAPHSAIQARAGLTTTVSSELFEQCRVTHGGASFECVTVTALSLRPVAATVYLKY